MSSAPGCRVRHLILLPALLILTGCGGGGKSSVSGEVKIDGQPLESGFISFYSEGSQGGSRGAKIEDGKFTVTDLAPGKMKAKITPSGSEDVGEESRNVRKKDMKKERTQRGSRAPRAAELQGNDKEIEIQPGSQNINFDLTTKRR